MNEIIKKNGITFGIVLGLFSVFVTATIYAIDLKLFTSWWVALLNFIVPVIIGFVLVSKAKKQLNGNISFKETFTVYFIAAVIGSVISKLFEYVLFNIIDPQAKETIKEIAMKSVSEMMEKFGAPAAAVNEAMQKAAETDNYSIGNIMFGLALGLVFHAIFGLILAAIFKSKSNEGL